MIDCYYTDQRQRWWQRDNMKAGESPQNQAYDTTCLDGLTTKTLQQKGDMDGWSKVWWTHRATGEAPRKPRIRQEMETDSRFCVFIFS